MQKQAKIGRPKKDEVRIPAGQGVGKGWRAGQLTLTPQEVEEKCNAYFAACDAEGKKYTKPGLALALGVTDDTLTRWEQDKEGKWGEVSGIVKGAFLKIRDALEQRTDAMAIFLTKQPCYGGYTDRERDAGSGTVRVVVSFGKGAKGAEEYGK